MTLLQQFTTQYIQKSEAQKQQNTMGGGIIGVAEILLDEKFYPSDNLKEEFKRLHKKAKEPMLIAVVGQFSAGKSTFLNAILKGEILPTGVTPITSKVCRLSYDYDFNLEVIYQNANRELRRVEDIFSLEDEPLKIIQEFHLKAPIPILKEISFLDTPGFNSQRQSDTDTTNRILEKVDGIIWLTLIDNAGKQSELEILEKFMGRYANKSLCVLNQKDRLSSEEEIQTAINYVKERFKQFFADVIAISSKVALQSQQNQESQCIQESLKHLAQRIQQLKANEYSQEKIKELCIEQEREVEKFQKIDTAQIQELYKKSNFESVITFIQEQIRPQAEATKEFTIRREIQGIIDIFEEQYEHIQEAHQELQNILQHHQEEINNLLKQLKGRYKEELSALGQEFHYHLESITEVLYTHLLQGLKSVYTEKSGILGNKIVKEEFNIAYFDKDRINEELFLGDSKNIKFFKKFPIKLKKASIHIQEDFLQTYKKFEKELKLWQESCEFLYKRHHLASDESYNQLRHFALKIYEEIAQDCLALILEMNAYIQTEIEGINTLFNGIHLKLTELVILTIEKRMEESLTLHLSQPKSFKIYIPTFVEIKTIVEESFNIASFLPRIEGEETTLVRVYQKMFIRYKQLMETKMQILKSRTAPTLERLNEVRNLRERITLTHL
ncbi:hypothetical protein CCZ01_01250 [Helicobacter monodelphidis]|uniref:dynamin family protein n=1 Tax=Helicobacter sp. 15-1451 TaxID=2004995 RepID=UPI000DCB015B|nr:dynamin family protein [Helicobacter sp. 15-1451]RAX58850.1 hypothetical protein CCZ01_01250 [Helicobacter sp. 15-1451]